MTIPIARHAPPPHAYRLVRDAAVFIPCYVALDWASYVYPFGPFYITPWNPQPALAVVLVMLGGISNGFAVFLAVFLADVVIRDAPGGYAITALSAMLLASGYGGIGWLLHRFVRDAGLRRLRDLANFCAIIAGGTAVVGIAYVGALHAWGQLAETSFGRTWLRFWIGDFVGIFVTAPLLLLAADAARRERLATLAKSPEAWLQCAILTAMAILVFAVYREDAARLFYLLFIPLIWIALRWGMPGAMVAATIAQAGVLAGMERGSTVVPILELQALVAAFTMTGLFLGVMSDERQQSEESLRHSLRLAAAGEMAGAIAHEVNQPLTALGIYGESAQMLLDRGGDPGALREVLAKMVLEVKRSGEVMRRLRDLFSSGTTRLESVPVQELLDTARQIGQSIIGPMAVALEVEPAPAGLHALYIDRVQVQLVLRNLLANSVDSFKASPRSDARIRVSARAASGDMVQVTVADNGAGMPRATRARLFQPFVSGKPAGMGLGLAVSRAIAEAHGGTLDAVSNAQVEFRLVLPCLPNA